MTPHDAGAHWDAQHWLAQNTFHHSQFAAADLARLKNNASERVSVCVPTLNEEGSIGRTVRVLRDALMERVPLIDELLVIDSGSSDATLAEARSAGAEVCPAAEILPQYGHRIGKGENLWKALHRARGSIVCYVDADIENIDPRFVTGLIGPLLLRPEISYVKALYDRPLALKGRVYPTGGGRVTEILVRPLFSMFHPELCALVQPLSGEYAGRRSLLETLAYPSGYGVETAHLIDIVRSHGMTALGQCDLDVRVHRNRSNIELGRTAFAILQGFFRRMPLYPTQNEEGGTALWSTVFRHFHEGENRLAMQHEDRPEEERPPMLGVPEYRTKFGRTTPPPP